MLISEANAGDLNVAPALSPDGSQVVFFSEKDLFSIDLYLADAATGQVRRKLIETASDPHFDSLQFINSAGDWDADRPPVRASAAIRKGKPVLVILRRGQRPREREIPFEPHRRDHRPHLRRRTGSRSRSPPWSAGFTDLFVYDLRGEARRGG